MSRVPIFEFVVGGPGFERHFIFVAAVHMAPKLTRFLSDPVDGLRAENSQLFTPNCEPTRIVFLSQTLNNKGLWFLSSLRVTLRCLR